MKQHKPALLYFLCFILIVLAIGGIYGGLMLIGDPSGNSLQLDIHHISNTAFGNYLFPGILLLLFNGLFPLFVSYALITQPKYEWMTVLNMYKDQQWPLSLSLCCG